MGHATTARAAMEVNCCTEKATRAANRWQCYVGLYCNINILLSILISICLWSFDLDVFGVIVGPQRSVATADGAMTLVELLSRRGEYELDGFAMAC